MLAELLGIGEDEAVTRLRTPVAITFSSPAGRFASELIEVIQRTLPTEGEAAGVEVVMDSSARGVAQDGVYISLNQERLSIASSGPSIFEECHPLFQALSACYVAGFAIARAVKFARGGHEPFLVRFADIADISSVLNNSVTISDSVLVGAGAIGNAFLRALRHLDIRGSLFVADPKKVSPGNENRCLYFAENSVGEDKAVELCRGAQPDFPSLELVPFVGTLHELVPTMNKSRVRRVFVATDSRRSRRSVQTELPLEVIDASTTAAEEVILYSHSQPTDKACLACIYSRIEQEGGREQDIADGLGVTIDDVRGRGSMKTLHAESPLDIPGPIPRTL